MPRFSAHLGMLFTEVPFPQRFEAATRAGFEACEFRFPFDYPAEEVAGWIQRARLTNVIFNMPAGDWAAGERGIAAVPGREADFRAGVEKSVEYARVLGTKMLHAMAGKLVPGIDPGQHRSAFIENLRYAAREAAKIGVTVTLEPINPNDVPGYFLTTQEQAHAIREEVDEPNLKVQLDLYHAQVVEGDLATKIRRYLPHLGHVQVAGIPGRHEPDDRGEINFPYLFALLDELGYAGWVGCEYAPRGRTEDGLGWMRPHVGNR
jgi:hydroxypyruvate isomerase